MTELPFQCNSVRLADGRRLAFASTGPPDGLPILYLHGAIGSPMRPSAELNGAIDRLGLHYLCVQRPGFGGSDPLAGRTMLDWADDIRELAGALGLRRIGLVGVSAGGPYALACARSLPDLVGAAAVCSSLSPACVPYAVPGLAARTRIPMRLIATRPRQSTAVLDRVVHAVHRHPALTMRAMTLGAPRTDRVLLDEPRARSTALDGLLAATAGGVGGLVEDYLICCRPWGFRPEDVGTEVHLWHGAQDALVPIEHAWQLAAALPRCRAAFDADDGHFFFRRRVAEILERLATAVGAAAHERIPRSSP